MERIPGHVWLGLDDLKGLFWLRSQWFLACPLPSRASSRCPLFCGFPKSFYNILLNLWSPHGDPFPHSSLRMLLSFRGSARALPLPAPPPQPAPGLRVPASSPPPHPLFASFFSRQGKRIEFRIRDRIECPAPLLDILPREGEKVRHGAFWSERKTQGEGACEPSRESQAEISSAGTEAKTKGRDLCSQQGNDRAGAAAV